MKTTTFPPPHSIIVHRLMAALCEEGFDYDWQASAAMHQATIQQCSANMRNGTLAHQLWNRPFAVAQHASQRLKSLSVAANAVIAEYET